MKAYEESLKVYRDNMATMDYAVVSAIKERDIEIARKLKQRGIDIEIIADTTGLTKGQIEKL